LDQKLKPSISVIAIAMTIASNILPMDVLAKPADDAIATARKYFSIGNLPACVSQCTKAIEMDPKNSVAYQLRGWTFYNMGKLKESLVELDTAIKLNPNRYENLTSKGEVLRQLARYDESRKILDQAVKVDPKRPDAYYLRGLDCLLQGLHVRAKQDLTDAINRGKGNPYLGYAYYWRGRTAEMREDHKSAVVDFSESIRLNPNIEPEYIGYETAGVNSPFIKNRKTPIGLLERGLSYSALGEHAKAIEDLTIVSKASPKETLLYEKRGNSYLALGQIYLRAQRFQ
jgi:tetratricopeptide (TPR) repeat protein